ncbi:Ecdysteroid kinase-domain-containing protein [Dunaliella salina]|uniref:Ecdysteroid kinase-domain-containing protein n=1 Tax=Dunaliella salina TaxID=3046 RepID=A0ABQ7H252_DUNSA|nr:Ecdysteroid kinase-domain-containing protein [Dunaliella salina]|eukprot:KAF5840920.1 Ecdysteroid kinase-domain-containing protein [Dunaliella salina]
MKGAMGVKELKPALEWLARFHSAFWSSPASQHRPSTGSLWPQGTFWHLGTRMEEFESMDSDDWLRDKAHEIDARLRGFSSFAALQKGEAPSNQHQTLVHGDFKAANLLFSGNWDSTAAYDFQYVGRGLGALDVAYLIICSSSLPVVEQSEDELLAHYHHHLMSCLDARGQTDTSYTMEVLRMHYDLATLDLFRFMRGWGWWGAIPSSRGDEYARKIGARVFGNNL